MQLSVIIVNYNVKYFLEQCLYSVTKAMKNIEGEVLVVDNHSTDGSFSFFQNEFPQVNFTWNKNNAGFAKANNQALKMASGDYVLFLNPDTIVPEDCFEKCIAFIRSRDDNIALGLKMIDGTGKFLKESKRAFPDPMTSLFKLSGLLKLFPHSKTFGKYHLGFLDENKNHEVDVLAGAFMMLSRKVLEKVNGFDEDYFMYGEDIDLSFRIQKEGFSNFYFAESAIIHFKGESTKKGSLNYVKMFYKAMIVFVKKHYGGPRAGIYNLLIHFAIFMRAAMAAVARFLKWVGLPVIDATIILGSFWIIKLLWNSFIKQEVNYSPNMLIIAFPVFTLLFLLSTYFSGLYDSGYKQSRLNKSTLISILVILSFYSLLPESLRFSRGILLFGSLTAFGLMTVTRILLVRWRIIDGAPKANDHQQIVIAGSAEEYKAALKLLNQSEKKEKIFGRIEPGNLKDISAIGTINDLPAILSLTGIKELVFCEGVLTFKRIIELLTVMPAGIRIKFFSSGSHSIIGSFDKDAAGEIIGNDPESYHLSNKFYRRTKRLFDVCMSLLFILVFPVHFIFKRRPVSFFKNVFHVLLGKNTWIGYSISHANLPPIPKGIITTTGLPVSKNILPDESLITSDQLYSKHYQPGDDLELIRKNYQQLS